VSESTDYACSEDAKGTDKEDSPRPKLLCEFSGSRLGNCARELDCRNQGSYLANGHVYRFCNGDKVVAISKLLTGLSVLPR